MYVCIFGFQNLLVLLLASEERKLDNQFTQALFKKPYINHWISAKTRQNSRFIFLWAIFR